MRKSVVDDLERSAARFDSKTVLVDGEKTVSFRELRDAARRIGSAFLRRGIVKKPVAIYLPKHAGMIAAFLGTAYCRSFYSPLDDAMSAARIQKILETLSPAAILTDRAHEESAKHFCGNAEIVLYEDCLAEEVDAEGLENVQVAALETDVLYVLFTSGSTGRPKGVVIPHRGVLAYADWASEAFGLSEKTILANQTPFYFSMSVFDIYTTLRNGGTLHILPKQMFSFPIRLVDYLSKHQVNTIYWVPTALSLVVTMKALGQRDLSCLKKVLFAGETMPMKYLNRWRKALPHAMYVNLFGPTEVTDICNYYIVTQSFSNQETLPIGQAAPDLETFVLDENDRLIESNQPGKLGELCVKGATLAYGYYGAPEKTGEVFVQNPLQQDYSETIYRTGDLVHYDVQGNLCYAGRRDFQIKFMGHRIELGEIDAAASSFQSVDAAATLYDAASETLVLFYSGEMEEEQMHDALKELLPLYMLPHDIRKLQQLPINLNGKIDRMALKKQI